MPLTISLTYHQGSSPEVIRRAATLSSLPSHQGSSAVWLTIYRILCKYPLFSVIPSSSVCILASNSVFCPAHQDGLHLKFLGKDLRRRRRRKDSQAFLASLLPWILLICWPFLSPLYFLLHQGHDIPSPVHSINILSFMVRKL
ncbi:uncharacterized protein LOC120212269 [Hibiscus syriacus]|uniref:uncharacterized protein LOC120212269 n=1 Tax=Hibiscus syriacus TaxID=106335 RepID=UPI0019210254|nr:uncharacterized protein LOC120212269 [Hibiscus syriacus]